MKQLSQNLDLVPVTVSECVLECARVIYRKPNHKQCLLSTKIRQQRDRATAKTSRSAYQSQRQIDDEDNCKIVIK